MGLGFHVARHAERDQVGEIVRLLIARVLAGNVAKLAEGHDVVNVKRLTVLFSGLAAYPALVAIALTCFVSLAMPVWPVIADAAASPAPGVVTAAMFRKPAAFARAVAEMADAICGSGSGRLARQRTAAISTLCMDWFGPIGIILASPVLGLPDPKAFPRAKEVLIALLFGGTHAEGLTTDFAEGYGAAFLVSESLRADKMLRHPGTFALSITEMAFSGVESVGMEVDLFATVGTLDLHVLIGVPRLLTVAIAKDVAGASSPNSRSRAFKQAPAIDALNH